jgi:cullin-4
MVQNLLRMKAALEEVWEKAFQRNETYGHALKEAFEHFINQRANKPAELIAKFLDQLLRSGNKGKSEEDLDANLEKALLLFRYISVITPPPLPPPPSAPLLPTSRPFGHSMSAAARPRR